MGADRRRRGSCQEMRRRGNTNWDSADIEMIACWAEEKVDWAEAMAFGSHLGVGEGIDPAVNQRGGKLLHHLLSSSGKRTRHRSRDRSPRGAPRATGGKASFSFFGT